MERVLIAETKNMDAIERDLNSLRRGIAEKDAIVAKVAAPFLREHIRRQFDTAGQHGGQPWAGFEGEPKYRAFRQRLDGKETPLQWSRPDLRESLTLPFHPSQVARKSGGLEFGTRITYAGEATSGGVNRFGEPYPARPIFVFRPEQERELTEKIQTAINDHARIGGI